MDWTAGWRPTPTRHTPRPARSCAGPWRSTCPVMRGAPERGPRAPRSAAEMFSPGGIAAGTKNTEGAAAGTGGHPTVVVAACQRGEGCRALGRRPHRSPSVPSPPAAGPTRSGFTRRRQPHVGLLRHTMSTDCDNQPLLTPRTKGETNHAGRHLPRSPVHPGRGLSLP